MLTDVSSAGGAFGCCLALLPDLFVLAQRHLPPNSVGHRVVTALSPWVPSGIGLAIGMYLTPNFTIPRVIGSISEQVWLRGSVRSHQACMLVTASGLVLGDGIASMVTTIIKALA